MSTPVTDLLTPSELCDVRDECARRVDVCGGDVRVPPATLHALVDEVLAARNPSLRKRIKCPCCYEDDGRRVLATDWFEPATESADTGRHLIRRTVWCSACAHTWSETRVRLSLPCFLHDLRRRG